MTISFNVTNTGAYNGDEIVQVYTHCKGDITRPTKELKGFARISLKAGETKRVDIPLSHEQLCYYNDSNHTYDVEGGTVDILVGASSADIRLSASIETEPATVKGTYLNPTNIYPVACRANKNGMTYNLQGNHPRNTLMKDS